MAKTKLKKLGLSDIVSTDGKKQEPVEKIFNEALLSPEEEIPKPEVVFSVSDSNHGNVYVGTKGNISLFKGKKKSRKTYVTSSIAGAVAGDKEIIKFKSQLSKRGLVLYVDTEQGRYDCKKVLQRTMAMSGINIKAFSNHLKFLTLRPFAPKTRREVINYAITKYGDKIDLVIIDGIRDLITNINDPDEATETLTDLLRWSSDYNLHILNILHENKGNNDARGHLGTELENKAEAIIRISKVENNKDYSAIEAEDVRNLSFDPYVFTINDGGFPEIADDVSIELESDRSKKPKTPKEQFNFDSVEIEAHTAMIQISFVNEHGMFDDVEPISAREFYKRLKKSFADNGNKLGDTKAREFHEKYLELGLLRDLNENEETKVKKLVPGFDQTLPF